MSTKEQKEPYNGPTFEFRVLNFPIEGNTHAKIAPELNELGKDGWYVASTSVYGLRIFIFLERTQENP